MDQDSRRVLEVVGLASCMPMYGIRDLQEILGLVVNSGATSVYQARPLKVSFYLQVGCNCLTDICYEIQGWHSTSLDEKCCILGLAQ